LEIINFIGIVFKCFGSFFPGVGKFFLFVFKAVNKFIEIGDALFQLTGFCGYLDNDVFV